MIHIPVGIFVLLCVLGFIGLLVLVFIVIDLISEAVYQKYEKEKHKSK